ncbi:MAG TPA: glutathione-disulfide reductase [Candidatus Binataceae bacterium]|nr:glutathione-disulfide reductase [Candidatus Binataceae bacterium]
MPRDDFDLFVIGAGSGGVRASRVAAAYGARVAVAEERYLGGTCVNVGCIPKKLLLYASEVGGDCDDGLGFGWTIGRRQFDWRTLITNKDREIARLNGIYRRLLEGSGVQIIEQRATIVDAHTIAIGDARYRTGHILVATGSWPTVPEVPGAEHAITSNEAFHLERIPERVVIVGGGYIGVEFAGIFHGLGARVTQLYHGPLFLRGFDDDARRAVADEMIRHGIDLRFEADVTRIESIDAGIRATLTDGSTLEADTIMYATGRHPHTRELGLDQAGVALAADGSVIVDEYSRSSVPNIYAIGDCANRIMLTPVAIAEGRAFAETVFNNNPMKIDYEGVPACVFSQPPLGTVGLTETRAREVYGAIDVYRSSFRPLKHTLSGRDERAMMKLVVDSASDRVVGCHMVGPEAGEIIQGFAVALKCGATKAQFDATIAIHPTAAEEFVTMREKVQATTPRQ